MPDMGPQPTFPREDDIMGVLRGVIDPVLGSDIVELGMAKGVELFPDEGLVRITVALTTSGCPLRAEIQRDVRARVLDLPGVERVKINWSELTQEEKAATMATARRHIAERNPTTAVPATTKVLMIASGKGGVGKSSVTVNLAAAIANAGYHVGLIDADIWGHSVPRMLGVDGRLQGAEDGKILPNSMPMGAGRIDVVSMGFLVEREETALMWRGLMLNRAVQHFLEDVAWPTDLDYLLIDMPPGTGDVQMGLAKMLPRAEMVVVTTPSRSAQKVATRAVNMGRQNYLRVLGVIENMSWFVTPDGDRHPIFGEGGGQDLADEAGVELIGQIPIENAVADGGDNGRPIALGTGPAADEFRRLGTLITDELAPPAGLAGCTARLLDAPDAETPVLVRRG
jgi:ATP-binding protein involved in chromosome partitioning